MLHGEEAVVFADAGYQRAGKRLEATGVAWQVTMRPGKRRAPDKQTKLGALLGKAEQFKANMRADVEHPFKMIKCQFGLTKVRYKGLAKNTAHLITLFALSNLRWPEGEFFKKRWDKCASSVDRRPPAA